MRVLEVFQHLHWYTRRPEAHKEQYESSTLIWSSKGQTSINLTTHRWSQLLLKATILDVAVGWVGHRGLPWETSRTWEPTPGARSLDTFTLSQFTFQNSCVGARDSIYIPHGGIWVLSKVTCLVVSNTLFRCYK